MWISTLVPGKRVNRFSLSLAKRYKIRGHVRPYQTDLTAQAANSFGLRLVNSPSEFTTSPGSLGFITFLYRPTM